MSINDPQDPETKASVELTEEQSAEVSGGHNQAIPAPPEI